MTTSAPDYGLRAWLPHHIEIRAYTQSALKKAMAGKQSGFAFVAIGLKGVHKTLVLLFCFVLFMPKHGLSSPAVY